MPYRQSWLELEKATGGPTVLCGTVPEMRAQFNGFSQGLLPLYPPASENVDTRDGNVEGVRYRIYTPKPCKGGLPLAIWSKHNQSLW